MAIRPTMFDAFVNTMTKSHVAKQYARQINNHTKQKAAWLEKIAADILEISGVDAKVSCRVKKVDSIATKLQRYMKEYDSYENKRNEIYDIFLGKGLRELVGDAYGIRYACDGLENTNLFKTIIQKAKNNPNFSVKSIENYYGEGINPYTSKEILDEFAKLQYKTTRGQIKETVATEAMKPAGYTRDNINAIINGVNTEIQVGGKYTIKWGDAEHFLYDMRQGKKLDTSELTLEQIDILRQVEKEYKKILLNKKVHDTYVNEYLNKIWKYIKESEEKNLSCPEFPPLPKGFSNILSAENIIKLAHV